MFVGIFAACCALGGWLAGVAAGDGGRPVWQRMAAGVGGVFAVVVLFIGALWFGLAGGKSGGEWWFAAAAGGAVGGAYGWVMAGLVAGGEKIVGMGWVSQKKMKVFGAVLSIVVIAAVWWVALKGGNEKTAAAKPARVQEVAPVARVKPAPVVDCLCSVGGECVGPQGGRYCMDDNGKKRYKKRESAGQ